MVTINGKEYKLLLTTQATKDIAKRYGGLSNLGESLLKAENFESAIDEILWLVCTLANQCIMLDAIKAGKEPELLTESYVALVTTPGELGSFKGAIMQALTEGMGRTIESEPSKNVVTG